MKSDPKHDVLGQPFMFLLDNLYNDLGSKLNMRIELLHVIDHMVSYLIHSENYVIHSINNLYFRNIDIGGAKELIDHFHPHSKCLLYTSPYTV